MQSARAIGTFASVLQRFPCRDCFGPPRASWDFFTDFIAFVKNAVRETAVRVHIGVQNCGKKPTF